MPNLQCAILSTNQIDDISNFATSKIPNIMLMKFYNNLITKLPKLNFPKLEVIIMHNCKIHDLKDFSNSNLPSLQSLAL